MIIQPSFGGCLHHRIAIDKLPKYGLICQHGVGSPTPVTPAPIVVALPSTAASLMITRIIYEVQPVEEFVEVILRLTHMRNI